MFLRETHLKNCKYDTCACKNTEACLCAALMSYVRACTAQGVSLSGWRTNVCGCIPPMIYFNCDNEPRGSRGAECQKQCHSLDVPCNSIQCISGCICPLGMAQDANGNCVEQDRCITQKCSTAFSTASVDKMIYSRIIREVVGLVCLL
ncbi:hypothetical protein NDU88_003813 [Pleurodeles waltl]|uniref:VWF/SSPO/Zonadhesin-like cysteine-rich domain-containing protein n=1 Tax=Pleurodeles waltl TaxID=8319 RepID=A0AAV7TS74_PLEWA|nr:hypothetical protein NDU88_003813 [Pleurodeles waltl]